MLSNEQVILQIMKIILDTDPGGDDAFALLWLLSLMNQGYIDLLAITTADGNVAAKQTFTNASQILTLVGAQSIEVGRGVTADRKHTEDATHIHGSDGLGNLSSTLPPAPHAWELARSSEDILIDRLSTFPHEITIVAIAPLTNLAAAEMKQPGILKLAKEIVIMGGAFQCPGNVAAHAEFNIWFNPDALRIVLESRDDCVMIPLDVTRRLIFTQEMAHTIHQAHPDNSIVQFMVDLCKFMTGTALHYRETNGVPGFLVHDAATLGYLFYPETLMLRRATVHIETVGICTRGQTLIDQRRHPKPNANAWVALQVDETEFFTPLIADLIKLSSL
jgi:inosine-uridine nucleoside N-ribohydrolase